MKPSEPRPHPQISQISQRLFRGICIANAGLRCSARRFSRKFQMTNPKTQTIIKSQIQKGKLKTGLFGNWNFGFGICLGFGFWGLGFPSPVPTLVAALPPCSTRIHLLRAARRFLTQSAQSSHRDHREKHNCFLSHDFSVYSLSMFSVSSVLNFLVAALPRCIANVDLRRGPRRFSRKFQITNPKTQTIIKSQIENRKLKAGLFGIWSFGFGPGTPGWVLGFGISIAGTDFVCGTAALYFYLSNGQSSLRLGPLPNPDEPEPKNFGSPIPDSEKLKRLRNSSEGL